MGDLRLVGFDADDTLWRSENYFDAAQAEYERIVGGHVALDEGSARERLYAVEKRNIAIFGYGVKGMTLSMIEADVDARAARLVTVACASELPAAIGRIARSAAFQQRSDRR